MSTLKTYTSKTDNQSRKMYTISNKLTLVLPEECDIQQALQANMTFSISIYSGIKCVVNHNGYRYDYHISNIQKHSLVYFFM